LRLATAATTTEDRCCEKEQGASFAEFVHCSLAAVMWRYITRSVDKPRRAFMIKL
jgi:hypothetical protein